MKFYNDIFTDEVLPNLNKMILSLRSTMSYPKACDESQIVNMNKGFEREFIFIKKAIINYLDDTYLHYLNLNRITLNCLELSNSDSYNSTIEVQHNITEMNRNISAIVDNTTTKN